MAQLTGLAHLGRDAEVRYLEDGNIVADISLAFSYGRKDSDGKRQTQWVRASLWGTRCESLQPYLLKGTRVYVVLDDVHNQMFKTKEGGQGVSLTGRVATIEFASKPENGQRQQTQQAQSRTNPYLAAKNGSPLPDRQSEMGDLEDEIPF